MRCKFVADRGLKTPIQRGFSLSAWNAAGATVDPATEPDDARVFHAGLWFHKRLDNLRTAIANIAPRAERATDIDAWRRQCIGFVNTNSMIASQQVQAAIGSADSSALIPATRLAAPLLRTHGGMISGHSLVESMVDGLRFALLPAPRAKVHDKYDNDAVKSSINAAVLYHVLEELWNACEWHGQSVVSVSDGVLIGFQDDADARCDAVSAHRRDSLMVEWALSSREFAAHAPEHILLAEASRRRITAVTRERRGLAIGVGTAQPGDFGPEVAARLMAADKYLEDFLDEPLPSWPGVTLRLMYDAWMALSPLAYLLDTRADRATPKTLRDLEARAPRVSALALQRALMECLSIPGSIAKQVVANMTWTCDPNINIWYTPLVPLAGGDVAVVTPALAMPNLHRSAEYWLTQGGFSIDRRGLSFERAMRESASLEFSRRAPQLDDCGVSSQPVNLAIEGVGDLDMILWFRDTVLVCELKCQGFPATEVLRGRYLENLGHAAAQLRARRDALEKGGTKALAEKLVTHGFHGRISSVEYAIVVNTTFGTLREIDGFPVVDEHILRSYIRGYAETARFDGSTSTTILSQRFYEDSCVGAGLGPYLRAPPHVADYRDRVVPGISRLWSFSREEEAYFFTTMCRMRSMSCVMVEAIRELS